MGELGKCTDERRGDWVGCGFGCGAELFGLISGIDMGDDGNN